MRAPTHMMAGAVAAAVVVGTAKLAGVEISGYADAAAVGLAVTGSLLPDIDEPGSSIGRKFVLPAIAINAIFKHRGITHSLVGLLLLAIAAVYGAFVFPLGYVALLAGYLSHLLTDALCPSGVPFLYPSPVRYGFPANKNNRVPTGSWKEYVMFLALGAAVLASQCQIITSWLRG